MICIRIKPHKNTGGPSASVKPLLDGDDRRQAVLAVKRKSSKPSCSPGTFAPPVGICLMRPDKPGALGTTQLRLAPAWAEGALSMATDPRG